jgi:superfamily I DNA and RNA helicase
MINVLTRNPSGAENSDVLDIVYGRSRWSRQQLLQVERTLVEGGVSGTLFFGYPVLTTAEARQPVDALLVGKSVGIVGILLAPQVPSSGDGWDTLVAEQDGLYGALEILLGRHPSLRSGRRIAVPFNTVTVLPALPPNPPATDATFLSLSDLVSHLQGLDGIADDSLYRRVRSVVEHVVAIKPAKRRDKVQQPDSRGARLKRIEQEIANLDRWQTQAAIATPDGAQRIRGLAGSGKTVVLALKAAYLHAQHPDWRIAVVFYTQSLYRQFQDLVRRFCFEHLQDEPDWSRVRILHAWGSSYRKGFYHEVAELAGFGTRNWTSALAQFGREAAFDGCCNELLSAIAGGPPIEPAFDAVLIDEAQDLPISFFRLAYHFTRPPKRIVWAYDELQQLSAASVPSARDLFGADPSGRPVVSLEDTPGEAHRDVVLPVCYRNPPWTLTIAHGLGFGTARSEGLVQHFDDPTLWDDVGYECVTGNLALGEQVTLRRKPESYPEFFERELVAADAVQVFAFGSDADQINWIVSSIHAQLEQDELEFDDFLIVLPDEYTSKSRAAKIVSAFGQRGLRAHNAGVETDRDVVFQNGSIAIAHIYRAKGNEAPFVYVLDAEYASGGRLNGTDGLASRRNKLFTAITRSRAWVRLCGVGPGMQEIAAEVEQMRANDYSLHFTIPAKAALDKLRKLHRDRTEAERRKIEKQKRSVADLAAAIARGDIAPNELDELSPAMKRALRSFFERLDE